VRGLAGRVFSLAALLIRFDDILEDSAGALHAAFERAIAPVRTAGRYQGVFPGDNATSSANVVEAADGKRPPAGTSALEAGSKAQLPDRLCSLLTPEALLDLQRLQTSATSNGDPARRPRPPAGVWLDRAGR